MPGPGGGSSGGGFRGGSGGGSGGFRGGSSGGMGGGGFRPGGFNPGPQHHRSYRPYRGFGFYRPMGCSSVLFIPVFLILFIGMMLIWLFGGGTYEGDAITSGSGTYIYDEEKFQAFADQEYQKAFGDSDCYEGNILLAVLTNDEADDYFAIAWVGDEIDPEIRNMFGGYTELGDAMNQYVNGTYYAYSLDSDLAAVVQSMTSQVAAVSDGTVLSHSNAYFRNYSDLDLSQDTVNAALTEFKAQTGIPMVIVVESLEEVFSRKSSFGSIFSGGALPFILIAVVVVAAVLVKKKSNKRED